METHTVSIPMHRDPGAGSPINPMATMRMAPSTESSDSTEPSTANNEVSYSTVDAFPLGGGSTVFAADDEEAKGGILEAMKISYAYTAADVRRRPRNTLIGILAVFFLVFCSGIVMLGIYKAPYILLRLSELSTGEMDVVLHGGNNTPLINFTDMNTRLSRSSEVHGSAPRWMFRSSIQSQEALQTRRQTSVGIPQTGEGARVKSTSSTVLVIDSLLEKEIGLGRQWSYRPIGYGEAHVYYSAAEYIGVQPNLGERISLGVNFSALLSAVGGDDVNLAWTLKRPDEVTDPMSFYITAFFAANNITDDSVDIFKISEGNIDATMIDSISGAKGKYPSLFGNAVIMDVKQLMRLLVDESCLLGPQVIQPTDGLYFPTYADMLNISDTIANPPSLKDYAMMMVTVFADRYPMYYADTSERNVKMIEKSNSLMLAAGMDFSGSIEFPIATTLDTFDSFKVLLVSSFTSIVIGVIILGGILMFTLLQINADERQFEIAMIRAQGMPRKQIVFILVAQTLAFTIPGTALGELFIFFANMILEAALAKFTVAPANLTSLPWVAPVVSTLMGLLLPLVATWRPVKRALGGSLRDALDIYRQVQNESRVVMTKLEELGLAMWQVILGVFLVVGGFMVYYLMPLSFIYQNMMLFFMLLDIILMCLVAGLCMMTYVLEPYAEAFVLFLLLWGKERRMKTLITKNLRSHREANSKAYMMFLLSVGCLTASGVMFSLLSTVSAQFAEISAGAPVSVISSSIRHPLDRKGIDEFMRNEGTRTVSHWGYSSFPLAAYPQIYRSRLYNLVGESRSIDVTALSETWMDSVYKDYNIVSSYEHNYQYPRNVFDRKDVVRSMYKEAPHLPGFMREDTSHSISTGETGSIQMNITAKERIHIPMILSSAVTQELGVDIAGSAAISYQYSMKPVGEKNRQTIETYYYAQPRALMKRVSGFFAISSMPVLFRSGSVLIPESYFKELLDPIKNDFEDSEAYELPENAIMDVVPKVLYVRLHKKVSAQDRQSLANALQGHIDSVFHTVVDTQSVLDELKTVQNLIMYFFYFSAVVCIVLCAFMMWVTFIANVQLNSWSIGVLRSLGFRNAQLLRSAVYEALCIVVSAFCIGLFIGIIVGLTMALQMSSFMALPLRFDIPYVLVLVILGLALVAAFVGSIIPFFQLRKKSISSIIRGI